jgi:ammonia channel protein AmtB
MNEEAVAAAIEAALAGHTTINLEIYYWWCTALMIAIHAGFLAYEMGASRSKNALASGNKNILAFAFMIPTFFAFGWWIYLAGYTWPFGEDGIDLMAWSFEDGAGGVPWSDAMGPNLQDQATGVFWAAFTLFACTTASIYSGAVIERIRLGAFIITAVLLGSVVWILGASWGWHPAGWMVTEWGYRDVAAAGVVHTIAGFFALGILIPLGPRIGKYNADGSANDLRGHNMPLTLVGLMLIIVGFFGFLGACLIYDPVGQWTNIYGIPSNLSAFAFNTLMGMAGGIIGAYMFTRDPFWMMSGALGGIFSVAAGIDLFYPPLGFLLGFIGGGIIIPMGAKFLEKMGIDDAVGAVAVHGICGVWGLLAVGIFASGYPGAEGVPAISFMGQLKGAVTMALLGFVPALVCGYILRIFGVLRVRNEVEVLGLDVAEIPSQGYPEFAIWEEASAAIEDAPRRPDPRDLPPRRGPGDLPPRDAQARRPMDDGRPPPSDIERRPPPPPRRP